MTSASLLGALDDVAGGVHVALPAPCGHLALDVHAQVSGAGNALLLAQLAEGFPRLVIDADDALRRSLCGHVDSVAGDRTPAVHRRDTPVSRFTVGCLDSRYTLGMRSRAGPSAPLLPAQTRKHYREKTA